MTPGGALVGVLRVARGRADGIAHFGDTPRAFLTSLAPLAVVQAVPSLWLLSRGDLGGALVNLLAALVALLAPPVLSHALAHRWGRGAEWPRYAVAANWSVWAVSLFALALAPVLALLTALGMPADSAIPTVVLATAAYILWLQWFIARHALALPGWQALGFSMLVNLGTLLLVAAPSLLGGGGGA